jgi:hypothetical protein
MGSMVSSVEQLEENELLKKLASTESIIDNDPFWNKLFSFNFNVEQMNKNVQKDIFKRLDKRFEELLYNTPTSGNFATLVRVFLRRSDEVADSAKCGK